jgi:hypothetical protein
MRTWVISANQDWGSPSFRASLSNHDSRNGVWPQDSWGIGRGSHWAVQLPLISKCHTGYLNLNVSPLPPDLSRWFDHLISAGCLGRNEDQTSADLTSLLHWHACIFIFREIHVFLLHSWICLFGVNRSYFHIETHKVREEFFSKTNSVVTGKQYARWSWF